MDISEFISRYFIRPIYTGEGYNIYNTIVYAICLIISVYVAMKVIKKWKIKINREFFDMVVPFIVLGGFLRAAQDYAAAVGLGKHWLFITPGIYLLVFFMFGATFFIAKIAGKGYAEIKKVGWAYTLLLLLLIIFWATNVFFIPLIFIMVCTSVLSLIMLFIIKRFDLFPASRENMLIVWGQMLDASASTIAISFLGYSEQHVVSGIIMDMNPLLFVLAKMCIVIISLYIIEKHEKNEEWRWLLKIVVLTLGLAIGIRNTTRVFIGV